ncbi:hypothetical protein P9112_005908 [Eukaryota sp. TZLM1-RC]
MPSSKSYSTLYYQLTDPRKTITVDDLQQLTRTEILTVLEVNKWTYKKSAQKPELVQKLQGLVGFGLQHPSPQPPTPTQPKKESQPLISQWLEPDDNWSSCDELPPFVYGDWVSRKRRKNNDVDSIKKTNSQMPKNQSRVHPQSQSKSQSKSQSNGQSKSQSNGQSSGNCADNSQNQSTVQLLSKGISSSPISKVEGNQSSTQSNSKIAAHKVNHSSNQIELMDSEASSPPIFVIDQTVSWSHQDESCPSPTNIKEFPQLGKNYNTSPVKEILQEAEPKNDPQPEESTTAHYDNPNIKSGQTVVTSCTDDTPTDTDLPDTQPQSNHQSNEQLSDEEDKILNHQSNHQSTDGLDFQLEKDSVAMDPSCYESSFEVRPLNNHSNYADRDSLWVTKGTGIALIPEGLKRFYKYYSREFGVKFNNSPHQFNFNGNSHGFIEGVIQSVNKLPKSFKTGKVKISERKYWRMVKLQLNNGTSLTIPFLPRMLADTCEYLLPLDVVAHALNKEVPPVGSTVLIPFASESGLVVGRNGNKYLPLSVDYHPFLVYGHFSKVPGFETMGGVLLDKDGEGNYVVADPDLQGPNLLSPWDYEDCPGGRHPSAIKEVVPFCDEIDLIKYKILNHPASETFAEQIEEFSENNTTFCQEIQRFLEKIANEGAPEDYKNVMARILLNLL